MASPSVCRLIVLILINLSLNFRVSVHVLCIPFSLASLRSTSPWPSFLTNTQLNFTNTSASTNTSSASTSSSSSSLNVVSTRCVTNVEYLQQRTIVSQETTNFYLSNLGRLNGPVYVYPSNSDPSDANLFDDNSHILSLTPSLLSCVAFIHPLSVPSSSGPQLVTLSPSFGADMSITPSAIIIGNPNRATQSYYVPSQLSSISPPLSVSYIEVVPYSSTAPYGVSMFNSSVVEYIVDWTHSSMGALMATDQQGTILAAYVMEGIITLYKPIVNRSLPYANNYLSSQSSPSSFGAPAPLSPFPSSDVDYHLTLPASFLVSSLAITSTLLAVSGTSSLTLSPHLCAPAVLLYELVDATTSNEWRPVNGEDKPIWARRATLDRDVNLFYSKIMCDDRTPVNTLPVALSPDSNWIGLGVPAWNSSFICYVSDLTAASADDFFTYLTSSQIGYGSSISLRRDLFLVISQQSVLIYNVWAFYTYGFTATSPINSDSSYSIYSGYWSLLAGDILPNRNVRPVSPASAGRSIQSFAVTQSLLYNSSAVTALQLVLLYKFDVNQPGTEIFPISWTTAGMQHDYDTGQNTPCPQGRFSDNINGTGFDGCQLCPLGTYSNSTGSTICTTCVFSPYNFSSLLSGIGSYCPVGSPFPYDGSIVRNVEPDENGTRPEFEAEQFRVAFEELMITTVFGVKNWSSVSWAFATSVVLCLIVGFLYALLACGCLKRFHPLVELLLHQFEHFHRPELGPGHRELNPHPHEHHAHQAHADTDAEGAHDQSAHSHANLHPHAHAHIHALAENDLHAHLQDERSPQSHTPRRLSHPHLAPPSPISPVRSHDHQHVDASSSSSSPPPPPPLLSPSLPRPVKLDKSQLAAIQTYNHLYHKRDSQLSGLFSIVFLLFVCNALIYATRFYYNYQIGGPCYKATPSSVCAPSSSSSSSSSTNSYRYETLFSSDDGSADPIATAGIAALSLAALTIRFDMIGASGVKCEQGEYDKGRLGLNVDGCVLVNSPMLCNDTSFVQIATLDEGLPYTCRISLNLPSNSLLSPTSVFTLLVPSTTNYVALRLSYYRGGWFDDPASGIAYASDPVNAAYAQYVTLGKTHFEETMVHPNVTREQYWQQSQNATTGNYIAPFISRFWNVGVLAWTYQIDNGETDPVPYFYTMYNTISSPNAPQFPVYASGSYAVDSSHQLAFQLSLYSTTVYRRQTVEKLIQSNEALLTILLAIIGIFHLILAIHEFLDVVLYTYYAYHVKRVVVTAVLKHELAKAKRKFKHASDKGKEPGTPIPKAAQGQGQGSGGVYAVHEINHDQLQDHNRDESAVELPSLPNSIANATTYHYHAGQVQPPPSPPQHVEHEQEFNQVQLHFPDELHSSI